MKSLRYFQILIVILTLSNILAASNGKGRISGRDDWRRRVGFHSSIVDHYPLGNFGVVRRKRYKSKFQPVARIQQSFRELWRKVWEHKMKLFHHYLFLLHTYDSIESILLDSWEAERNPEKFFGKTGILQNNERDVVRRRVVSSRTLRKLVGAGYTPRLVWLYGVMLRGIIHCTTLPKIFEVRSWHGICSSPGRKCNPDILTLFYL
jgi:hypothetical protein